MSHLVKYIRYISITTIYIDLSIIYKGSSIFYINFILLSKVI
nr:MAG TPA: hypothetical protein [Caudoviricetes sp.]